MANTSPSYDTPYGGECTYLDLHDNEPCWGVVQIADTSYDEEANDETVYYACEGHMDFFLLSILSPPLNKYLPEAP
jgi:hypothetical protein